MDLRDAYDIIRTVKPEAALHMDHICSESGVHDLAHCPTGEGEAYTADDAARDSAETLEARFGGAQ